VTTYSERHFSTGAWPWILLVTAAFVVSTNHVLGRYVSGEIPPMGLAFWRVVVGAAVVMPFAWRELIRQREVIVANWRLFALMAMALMPAGNALVYVAYNFTTVINGSIILTSQPALTLCAAWLVLGHTINKSQMAGTVIAITGVLIIILRGNLGGIASLTLHSGDLIMIAGTLGFAFYTAMIPKVPRSVGPLLILVIVQVLGALTLAPFYLYESLTYLTVPVTTRSLLVIGWIGTAIAVVAVGLNNIAVLALGPAKATIGLYCRTLFTTAMAMVLLGEPLEAFHFVAIALIMIGIYLMTRARNRPRGAPAG
jgi:drug/metabolite transporter (DMT)-like permease